MRCPKSERQKPHYLRTLVTLPAETAAIVTQGVRNASALLRSGARMTAHSVVGASKRPKPTRVLIVCDLLTASGNHRVTVRDISRSSAHIIGAKRLPPESDGILKRGELFAAVRISDVNGDEAELRFYRQLSPQEIENALLSFR
jgi:hypothetical protein